MPRPHKIEKSKDFKGSMIKLFKSLKGYHFAIIIGLVLSMVSSILSLIAPNRLSDITDYITAGLKPNVENLEVINKTVYGQAMGNFSKIYMNVDYNSLDKDQQEMKNALITSNTEDDMIAFSNLSDKTLDSIISSVEVNGVVISKDDQKEYFTIVKGMNSDNTLEKIDELPESIRGLIKPKLDMDGIKSVSIFLAVLYIISAICSYLEQIIMALSSNRYGYGIRKQIDSKINKLPLRYFDGHETGDVLSRVTNDVDTMAMNLSNNLSSLIGNLTIFLGSVIMMFVTNPVMAATGIIASFVGFIFMFLIKPSQSLSVGLRNS